MENYPESPTVPSGGAFTNYFDKTRQVGGTGNVKGKVKKFHHKCQQGGRYVVNNGQNLVNVVCERPLFSKYPNREEDHRTLCHSSMYQGQGTNMDRKTQKFMLLDYVRM